LLLLMMLMTLDQHGLMSRSGQNEK
jgi:hypothetical protein